MLNTMVLEIFECLSGLFRSSWEMLDSDAEAASRKMWIVALEGIRQDQAENALRLIASKKTEFQKFPPTPQEFRGLCEESQDPSHVLVKLDYHYTHNTESSAYLEFKEAWSRRLGRGKKMRDDVLCTQ